MKLKPGANVRKIILTLMRRQEPEKSEITPEEHYKALKRALAKYSEQVANEEDTVLKKITIESIEEFTARLDMAWGKSLAKGKHKKDGHLELMIALQELAVEIERDENKYKRHSQAAADERRNKKADRERERERLEKLDRAAWMTNAAYWMELRPPENFMRRPDFYNSTEVASIISGSDPNEEQEEQIKAHFDHMLEFAAATQNWKVVNVEFDPAVTKWAKKRPLGEGSSGMVYTAAVGDQVEQDGEADVSLALKIITFEGDKGMRLEEQCRTLFRTRRHPHVVNLIAHELDISRQEYRIFMEVISGGTLWRMTHYIGPFVTEEAKPLILQIAKGLSYLHGLGLIHRDLKGDNILVNLDGCLKICDLDTIKNTSQVHQGDNDIVGTPFWMSPEAARGEYSARSDVWSLGCIAVEILTKSWPWNLNSKNQPNDVIADLRRMDTDEKVRGPPLPGYLTEDLEWLDFFKGIFVGHELRVGVTTLLEDPWLNPPSQKQ